MTNEELLDSLALVENGELTRAAIMPFHHNPERFVFGAYVKVGYFETGADLRFYDEFHGSLIAVADEIVETINRTHDAAPESDLVNDPVNHLVNNPIDPTGNPNYANPRDYPTNGHGRDGNMHDSNDSSADSNFDTNDSNGDTNDSNGDSNRDINRIVGEDALLAMVLRNSQITYNELADTLGVSYATVARMIKSLRGSGPLYRKGSTRGEWVVRKEKT
ncbi:MAG: winged helix-turn-helix transcriptional regulator [Lachnospiraceae bacterium]|jgi:predicted HTH transcriptional regulator|nr:winged helix-turn-helix transcriptional regulator [Lachnospiraceae bacterium]